MGSLYQINVTELEDIIGDVEYGGSVQPPAGYTGYAVVDSGSNIRSAPTSDLQLFYVYEYESNHGPLAFTAAQAATLVSEVEYVKHSVSFSAPQGDSVGVSDNLQNLATLTADDVSELNSLGLSITAVDTAGDIENVPLGEVENSWPRCYLRGNEYVYRAKRRAGYGVRRGRATRFPPPPVTL